MGLTERVAAFVEAARAQDLPEEAMRLATDAITDSVGVALVGSRQPIAEVLLRTVPTTEASDDAFLFGTHRRAAVLEAALYNGAVIHAIDYDDTAHPSYTHPSAHLVPVLFGLGRQLAVSGPDLLLAYVLGLEIENKLGRALNMAHYLKGWHATGTFGAITSAVAASKLLGLSVAQIAMALGIAGSAASGLRANFGTMTKPLHAGYAARSGLLAALLARDGFTAAPDVLENRHGYLEVFAGHARPDPAPLDALGRPWEILTPYGIALKAFPACGSAHPAIEAALAVRRDVGDEEIVSIRVGTNELCAQTLVYADPQSPLEGKFSMEFCVAAALVRGAVTMDTFTSSVLRDPSIRRLMGRIRVSVDERVRHNSEHGAVVTARTAAGRTVERMVELARGKPARWMSRDELWGKFWDCARAVLPEDQARKAFDGLQAIGSAPSVESLLAPLRVSSQVPAGGHGRVAK